MAWIPVYLKMISGGQSAPYVAIFRAKIEAAPILAKAKLSGTDSIASSAINGIGLWALRRTLPARSWRDNLAPGIGQQMASAYCHRFTPGLIDIDAHAGAGILAGQQRCEPQYGYRSVRW